MHKIQQNKTTVVQQPLMTHDSWPGNEIGLFFNDPEPTRGY